MFFAFPGVKTKPQRRKGRRVLGGTHNRNLCAHRVSVVEDSRQRETKTDYEDEDEDDCHFMKNQTTKQKYRMIFGPMRNRAVRKAPRTKLQAPEKLQAPTFNNRTSNIEP
jgi:hypothetical protein